MPGLCGQVKLQLDGSGAMTDYYGYSSFGNRRSISTFSGAGILPIRLESELSPIPEFGQSKLGSGTTQEMTPRPARWAILPGPGAG